MTTSLLYSQLKHFHFHSLLIRLSVYQTQVYSLGTLITFVNTFFKFSYNVCIFLFCIFSNKLDHIEAIRFITLTLKTLWKATLLQQNCYHYSSPVGEWQKINKTEETGGLMKQSIKIR